MGDDSDLRQRDVERWHVSTIEEPPQRTFAILRQLGPGLIIAAAIVGSGELIMTTKTGAEAGFWLLWLIVIGCLIKVFCQVEFGRYAVIHGRTSLQGMDEVPGPRLRVNWLMWYWVLMFLLCLGQLGGILGGVGQALAMTVPITGDYNAHLEQLVENEQQQRDYDAQLTAAVQRALESRGITAPPTAEAPNQLLADELLLVRAEAERLLEANHGPRPPALNAPATRDDMIWNVIVTLLTLVLLINGRYGLIQSVSMLLVVVFMAVTIGNLFALQSHPQWHTSLADLAQGFRFQLPPGDATAALVTALATFGIIGVGASEIVAYPYWCLEKGYARFSGPHDDSEGWARRATGWLRVMRWDAWCSMVVYTFATVAFYILGAAVLNRSGQVPANAALIRTLAEMYVPVFGAWAGPIFLFGAVAVLFSTFFVATAGNARMAADAVQVFGLGSKDEEHRRWWIRFFCGVFPLVSLGIYMLYRQPVTLIVLSGLAQAVMLPMLGGTALFFRYRRGDSRLQPSRWWDLGLWISFLALLVAGGWGAATTLPPLIRGWLGS